MIYGNPMWISDLRTAAGPVRYVMTVPTDAQRAAAAQSPLYQIGDALLIWANEGDLCRRAPVEPTVARVEAACEAHLRAWADCEQSSYVYSASDIDDAARACMRAALRAAMGVAK